MALAIKVEERQKGEFLVSLSGSIDLLTYTSLEDKLRPSLTSSTRALILNMEGVVYVSSMAISVIFKTRKYIEELGGYFLMANLQPQVKAVFDIIKALPAMRVFESMEEADRYFAEIQRKEIEKHKGSPPDTRDHTSS